MSFSHSGWSAAPQAVRTAGVHGSNLIVGGRQPAAAPTTPNTTQGGSVQPNVAPNTAANFMTTASHPNDPALASRKFLNPLTGNRQVASASSVYAQANVPAYLAQAVNSLNQEQLQRRLALSGFQQELLNRFDAGGPGQYQIANVLQGLAVQPGAHFSTRGISDPSMGQGYMVQSQAAASLAQQHAIALHRANSDAYAVHDLQNQVAALPTGWAGSNPLVGQQRINLGNRIQSLNTATPSMTAAMAPMSWAPPPSW